MMAGCHDGRMDHRPNPRPDGLSDDPDWVRAGQWLSNGPRSDRLDAVLLGVPAHLTSLSPTNADQTPAAVRAALWRYATWCASRRVDLAELQVADWGDVADPDAHEDATIDLARQAADTAPLTVALGGDNSLTYAVARGVFGEGLASAGLVTFDAHHDIRTGVNNGSPVRRLVEAGLDPTRIVQIGIADFANSRAYSEQAAEWGITVIELADVRRRGMPDVVAQAMAIAGGADGKIHVDVDLDVCDRAVVPGCPASVPGGLAAHEILDGVFFAIRDSQAASMDIAEVDASADAPDGRTVRLAARCVLEAFAALASRVG
jgi:formiminoglutamase